MKHLNQNTAFWKAVQQSFNGELKTPNVSYAGKEINYFGYQIAVHKMQLNLNASGIIPHRGWKVTPLKQYYGLTGSGKALVEQIIEIQAAYQSLFEQETLTE
jgi:hypothetical protein